MKTALFIDFDDSFSYNVIQELNEAGLNVEVKHWMDFEDLPHHDLLILGPGPGEPKDYQRIYPLVKEWLNLKKPFVGICLGHQIFWDIQGFLVTRSQNPVHGQKVELNLNDDWQKWLNLPSKVSVQRYNSLAVIANSEINPPEISNYIQEGEIIMSRSSHIITYQFHPESLGTSYRQHFFRPILQLFV